MTKLDRIPPLSRSNFAVAHYIYGWLLAGYFDESDAILIDDARAVNELSLADVRDYLRALNALEKTGCLVYQRFPRSGHPGSSRRITINPDHYVWRAVS